MRASRGNFAPPYNAAAGPVFFGNGRMDRKLSEILPALGMMGFIFLVAGVLFFLNSYQTCRP